VLRSYLPAIVFLILGGAVGGAFAVLNSVIGPSRDMIAMLFILFDIEVVFLYPIALELRAYGTFALIETVVFIVLLFVAFVYVWRRGALEWR
jgi:NADH-quinone oxidoreductase subunit A